jgi:hypothetical protein
MNRILLLLAACLLLACPSEDDGFSDSDDDDATACPDDDDDSANDDDSAADDDDAVDDDDSGNTPPEAPKVNIVPGSPTPGDDLDCQMSLPAVDPDGDTVYYRWAWTVDDVDSGITLPKVTFNETQDGETWTCNLFAFDGIDESEPSTVSVTIEDGNEPPSPPEVDVIPDEPVPTDDLLCIITTDAEDPEGGEVQYTFAWTVDGSPTAITTSEIPNELTSEGEVWTCIVTAQDDLGDTAEDEDSVTVLPPL